MYTAKLIERVNESGLIKWKVAFNDGADGWEEFFQVAKYSQLQERVAKRIAELNSVETFTLGAVIDSPVVTPPTQAEIDRVNWLNDWRTLQKANELRSAGVIADTLPAYVDHKNKVITNFKVGYINYL